MPREAMEFDVLIVVGGLAGLAAAIQLEQLAPQHDRIAKYTIDDEVLLGAGVRDFGKYGAAGRVADR